MAGRPRPDEAGAEVNHRLRVANAIGRLPQLVGFCPHDKPVVDADSDPAGERVVTVAADLNQDKSGGEFWTKRRECPASRAGTCRRASG